jgi:hypothetical protein
MWCDIRPEISWANIKVLPVVIRSRLPERITSITVRPDGTVEVWTQIDSKIGGVVMVSSGWTYQLKKGSNGWQIEFLSASALPIPGRSLATLPADRPMFIGRSPDESGG